MTPTAPEVSERDLGMEHTPAVEVRSLRKVMGGRVLVLDGVDLTVAGGQVLGLAGPNGAGKSTILKVLLGLVRPSGGSVRIFGQPAGPGAPVLARVGAMVDGPGFLPYLSGRRNLELAWRSNRQRISPEDLRAALDTSGLDGALERPYRTYSHGMRYRLGLAMAMMGHPDLLLLDEPTTGLDPAHTTEIATAIHRQAATGATFLLSSHDLGFVQEVCTHAGFLIGGRIESCQPVPDLVSGAGSIQAAYLLAIDRTTAATSTSGSPR